MGKSVSVIVKNNNSLFGIYPTISAAAKSVEDYFEFKLNRKRPCLYPGFCDMTKGKWVPDERSQLCGWSIEKN